MKNLFFLFLIVWIVFQPATYAQTSPPIGSLTIYIKGVKQAKGMLQIGLFNHKNADVFPNKKGIYRGKRIPANQSKVTFENLPYGDYAVAIFHDLNNNKKLDTGFLGIPDEPYGFSQNYSGSPSFNKARLTIQQPVRTITIRLID